MQIIPAIDIIEGKCVRLTQGDYSQKKIYHEQPLEVAKQFEDAGLERLHLVDLDGAKAQRIINFKVLEKIATRTGLKIDFGGGLKSSRDVRIAFECGANQITGGTIAVKRRTEFLGWLKEYGPEKIILGADVENGKIAIHAWQEQSNLELFDFLESYLREGIKQVICTDISKDGLLQGASTDLYDSVLEKFPGIELTASGGVSSIENLKKLEAMGCHGAIIGKAIYEGKILFDELSSFLTN